MIPSSRSPGHTADNVAVYPGPTKVLDSPTLADFQDADIVKKGHLHIKRPPTQTKLRLKAWQKRYFVLRDLKKDNASSTCLEIYEHGTKWSKREKYIVDLKQVTDVDEYVESRNFPHAFIVSRKGQSPLVIGAGSDLEMREWLIAVKLLSRKCRGSQSAPSSRRQSTCSSGDISRLVDLPLPKSVFRKISTEVPAVSVQRPSPDAALEGFPVRLQPTTASQKHGVEGGDYMMVVSNSEVILRVGETDTLTWPLTEIRKFKSEDMVSEPGHIVTLEASGNCGSTAGVYLFKTARGRDLIARVRDASKQLSAKRREQQDELERLKCNVKLDRASSVPCLTRTSPPKQQPVHSYLPILPDYSTEVNAGNSTPEGSREGEGCRPRKDSGFDEVFEDSRYGLRVRKVQSTPGPPAVPTPPPRPRHTITSLSLPIPEHPDSLPVEPQT